MSRLALPFLLLFACDPLPPVPVPTQEVQQQDLPPPAAAVVTDDTDAGPVIDANRAPVITSITVDPASPRTGDDITVEVEGEDPDGDYIRWEYAWLVNEVEIRGERQSRLSNAHYKKGDTVQLRVLATAKGHETEGLSGLIIVRNTPPEIASKPRDLRSIDGFQVQATDIDEEPLSYRLEGEPEGMSIDETTGIISYKGSESAKAGDYRVNVIVEDPDDGSAKWAFGITVSAGSGANAPAEPTAEDLAGERHSNRGYKRPEEPENEEEEEEDDWADDGWGE